MVVHTRYGLKATFYFVLHDMVLLAVSIAASISIERLLFVTLVLNLLTMHRLVKHALA